jgi:hypothetical protein
MSSKGCVAFKYKSMYYIFYNYLDSYLSQLGNFLIKDIEKMIDENYLEAVKKKIRKIPLQENYEDNAKDKIYRGLINSVNYYKSFNYYTSKQEPKTTTLIRYVYIIDFDNQLFSIKMKDLKLDFDIFDLPSDLSKITKDQYEEEKGEKGEKDNQDDVNSDQEDILEGSIEYNEYDSKKAIMLKIEILENQNKINRIKLALLALQN